MSNLKVFDQLVSDITKFVAPIKFLAVKDPESSQQGIVAAQTTNNNNGYLNISFIYYLLKIFLFTG